MYLIINLLVFVITLFLYIHIYFQVKTSNYLEIYEVDNLSKDKLEELCDLKQPLVINDFKMLENIDYDMLYSKYRDFDVKIKKKDDTIYLPIKLSALNELMNRDPSNTYLCDNNEKSRIDTCDEIINNTGANFIHPFDNENVICGQASCAKEVFEETRLANSSIAPSFILLMIKSRSPSLSKSS